jgi:hypothetical protein
MKAPRHSTVLKSPGGHAIVAVSSESSTDSPTMGSDPTLSIQDGVFGEPMIIGLVDDWIVPTVVDRLIEAIVRRNGIEAK